MTALLHCRHAPAPDDAAHHLRLGCARIDDAAGAVAADRAAKSQQAQFGVDADFDEDSAEGAHRHALAILGGVELASACDLARAGGAHRFGDCRAFTSAFAAN